MTLQDCAWSWNFLCESDKTTGLVFCNSCYLLLSITFAGSILNHRLECPLLKCGMGE